MDRIMKLESSNTFQIKHLTVDFKDETVSSFGVEIKLDNMAVRVLKVLVAAQGQTVHNEDLMDRVWGEKPSSPEVIPAAVSRLRKMFKKTGVGDDVIKTVHKIGYRLELPGANLDDAEHSNRSDTMPVPKWAMVMMALTTLVLLGLAIWLWFDRDMKPGFDVRSGTEVGDLHPADGVTQLYVLRHTEKVDSETEDPELSPDGFERATYWKKVLQHVPLDVIYTTNFKRNLQTAQVIGENLGIETKIYFPMSMEVKPFLQQVQGQRVLLIGHSNTIPDLLNRLTGSNEFPPMSHQNYNLLYIVSIAQDGQTSTSTLYIEKP